MKLNWGTGIATFYSLFVLLFVGIVIKSKTYDLNMVKTDYYADDLNYQKHFDQMQNERNLTESVKIVVHTVQSKGLPTERTPYGEGGQIEIDFPKNQNPTGKTLLFHPAKAGDDRLYPIQTDAQNRMTIPLSKGIFGRWKIQIEWTSEGKTYFKEENIMVNGE